jgi:ribosomal protein S13
MDNLTIDFVLKEICDLTEIEIERDAKNLSNEDLDCISSIVAAIYNVSNNTKESKWHSEILCDLIEDSFLLKGNCNLKQLSDFAIGEWQKLEAVYY